MTKEQFNNKIFSNFEREEINLINKNIYYNENHLDYYIKYKSEDYKYCYKYLIDNRNILKNK